jgi:hypothetical protein
MRQHARRERLAGASADAAAAAAQHAIDREQQLDASLQLDARVPFQWTHGRAIEHTQQVRRQSVPQPSPHAPPGLLHNRLEDGSKEAAFDTPHASHHGVHVIQHKEGVYRTPGPGFSDSGVLPGT